MLRCKKCHFSTAFKSVMLNHLARHTTSNRKYYDDSDPETLKFNPFVDGDTLDIPDPEVINSVSGGGGDFGGGGASGDF